MDDIHFMRAAIKEARKASEMGEVPIGAVAMAEGEIIARAHNIREATNNPLGHAELLLIEKLAKTPSPLGGEGRVRGGWRLEDVTVYITCEPCPMCMEALIQARVGSVVWGCDNPNWGRTNPKPKIKRGVLASECAALLSDFFKVLRRGRK